jgi:hypothetical protein
VALFVCFYKLNIRATRFYTIKIVSYQSELIHDVSALIIILNEWVKAGESPLLVGHHGLCEFLRSHPRFDQGVAVVHFGSLLTHMAVSAPIRSKYLP